jgi:hypothetical protein
MVPYLNRSCLTCLVMRATPKNSDTTAKKLVAIAINITADRMGSRRRSALPTSANREMIYAWRTTISTDWPISDSAREPRHGLATGGAQQGALTWERMKKLAADFLPKPRILHPWPRQRFAVRRPR